MANKDLKDWYKSNFDKFEKKLNGESKSFIHQLRKEAISKLDEYEFPTLKDEDWKYTNINPILKQNFIPSFIESYENYKTDVNKFIIEGLDSINLVFVNGMFSKDLSDLKSLPKGVKVDNLHNVAKNNPELLENKFTKISKTENAFNALNAAYAYDGTVVIIENNIILEKPITVLYISEVNHKYTVSFPRNFILAGKNSQVSLIVRYSGQADNPYFTNIVTEISLDENAIVNFYKIQDESVNAYHIEKTDIQQKDSSIINHFSFSFGGKIVRNDINTQLNGQNIECHLYGLYLGKDDQHIDHHTFVDHAKPNCMSNELYKGILDDSSKGVFSGKILVQQEAQKTNAFQSNKSVLLSDEARIDTKPQLEIYADDVKCSHGATVGHLDDEAYFYIRSRGVPGELAKSMLIRAFANDVVDEVKFDSLKEKLNHMIFEHLHRVEI